MDKENGKSISRRDFFKIAGAAGMVTAGLVGCNEQSKSSSSFPQLFYPLMTRQFFCDFHEKSEDFCVS